MNLFSITFIRSCVAVRESSESWKALIPNKLIISHKKITYLLDKISNKNIKSEDQEKQSIDFNKYFKLTGISNQ